ncbi:histidine kinase [Lonsdalea populi]|uniref:Histidine kinase n=5 Tax=Pectobacteriaceae TaxID=1903410 RepID=A0ACD1JEU2_9GAMM|nr:histidine kinase [Lonsdalea quercina]RAT19358.1 histidine kinase [Lonsdalea populi]RAT26274.1 histidine kinase [Lonsdalea populi]RAT33438.1 histidine kinase [Lonsdalea populi]RAT34403.1 histidine kinase [Lonsdalea populi]
MIMQGRLFWKILVGLWLTLIVISQLLWMGFSFYGDRNEPPEIRLGKHIIALQMTLASEALQQGGLSTLYEEMSRWPESERGYISASTLDDAEAALRQDDSGEPLLLDDTMAGDKPAMEEQQVIGPDGRHYLLRFDIDALRKEFRFAPPPLQRYLHIPGPILWIGAISGLLFSAMMAWNLARPLNQLRAGFGQVAQGDLSVRLLPAMRRRHDEISEVARDFDSMVERLEVLVSAREQLLHDVSHELRSPLARLQLAIGLARQNDSHVESSLQRIEREAERMDKMIGELLTLSRTENAAINEEYFDLLGLVNAVVNDARYEGQVPGVEIILNSGEYEDYTIKGMAELMRRAFDNIIRNALRFSSQGQTVTVTLRQSEREWFIDVADRGPGVEKGKLSSIFDPFIRIDSPQSGKGYGLGLAIARKAVLAHGGRIEAMNQESSGLLIRISLPRWK